MRRLIGVLIIAVVLAATLLLASDWRFWLRYLNSPDNPVAEIDWFTPLVEVGTPEVENLKFAKPDERVFTEASLQATTDYAKTMESYALLVSHRGAIQWEYYGPGFDAERMTDSQSMHKPLVPLMVGAAIADGYIDSIDDPVSKYLDEWQDDPRGAMSLRDLLYMESGLDQPAVDPSPFAPGTRAFMTSHIEDAILNLRLNRPAGTSFDFNFLTTQLLSLIVERATDQHYPDYFRERFWSRIGGGRARLRLDRPGGNAHTFCCIQTTARGWARVGELVMGEGRWADDQVLPASWIGQMITTARGPQFGMHIWLLDGDDTERVFSEVRERGKLPLSGQLATPIIFFEGRGGQRVYILPALETVVVRTGVVNWGWDDVKFINGLVAGFTGETASPPPDYAAADTWAALPEREDAADFAPPGEQHKQADAPADVFFIHPTTFLNPREWHAAIDDPRVTPVTDTVIKGQASAFNDCCAVYAPRYRQASLKALMDRSGRGSEAYDLAYGDVRRAFTEFAARSERPFIIAGHSQGALHALRLAAEVADREAWRQRLVAAYVVGIGIAQARYQDDLARLSPCQDDSATGCIVSWNSFGPEADATRWRASARSRSAEIIERIGDDSIQCNNPLAWTTADAVAVVPSPGPAPLPAASSLAGGAACEDGALFLAQAPGAEFKPLAMPGGIWHLGDFALFYQAVRVNAAARVDAFIDAK
jgi:CubicO group peptidase (beta-lactamase class C family)